MNVSFKYIALPIITIGLFLSSCSKEEEDNLPSTTNENQNPSSIQAPRSYEFLRNGSSSVSYSGQTDRLNQLAEIKTLIQSAADNGSSLSAQGLKEMYENTNGTANGRFSFSSTKQLKDKTFDLDKTYFSTLFDETQAASDSAIAQVTASNGKAGLHRRSNGSAMLLTNKGHEITQAVEKGLMGAVFYHQIVNVYLTDSKIGPAVNNNDIVSGENYTEMEHHMDEAFGYFGAPTDYSSNYTGNGTPRYWASYSNTADAALQLNDKLMNAYKIARAAIVAGDLNELDKQVTVLNNEFEVLIAATSIHYINQSLTASNTGDRIHLLTEAFYFLKALRYSNINHRQFSQAEVDTMLYTDFGDNLWQVSSTGLNTVKNKLSSKYGLDAVKNQL